MFPPHRPRLEPLEDRLTPAARLQVINGAIFDSTGLPPSVDVYVNDVKVADDIASGRGTPFVDVPSGVAVKVDVVEATAPTNAAPLETRTVTFADGTANIAVSPGLAFTPAGRETAADPGSVDLLVYNGVDGTTAIDVVVAPGFGTVADDVGFGTFAGGYASLPARAVEVDVIIDGSLRGIIPLDLTGAAGKSVTLVTDGWLVGASPPQLFPRLVFVSGAGVYADGTSVPRPRLPSNSFAVGGPGSASVYNSSGDESLTISPFGPGVSARVAVIQIPPGVRSGQEGTWLIVGSGPGAPPTVSVYNSSGRLDSTGAVFEESFTGGVFVAAGDFNGDGLPDLIVTPDQGGGPRVRVFSGFRPGGNVPVTSGGTVLADFFAIEDTNFRGGARAAAGDLNGDGTADLVVAAGFGGGPRVAGFDGRSVAVSAPRKLFGDFFVFEPTLRNGVFVAAGDLDGDGFAEVVAGGGPGGGPRVLALSGRGLAQGGQPAPVANFFAGDPTNRDGVRLTLKDLDGDDRPDIVAGLGSLGVAQVRAFAGKSLPGSGSPTVLLELNPFPDLPAGGVFVG